MKNEITIFNEELSDVSMVVCEDLKTKTTIMTYFLHEYAILNGREVLLYTFDRRCDYYYRNLLAHISGIDKKILTKYLYPWLGFSHYNTDMINRFYFVSAIEKVQQSNLFMIGENATPDTDYLDSILEILEFDSSTIIIIEDFDLLLERTRYSRKEVIRRLRESALKYDAHFVVFSCRNGKENHILETPNIEHILYGKDTFVTTHKGKLRKLAIEEYQNQKLLKRINVEYNKNNYDIERKG